MPPEFTDDKPDTFEVGGGSTALATGTVKPEDAAPAADKDGDPPKLVRNEPRESARDEIAKNFYAARQERVDAEAAANSEDGDAPADEEREATDAGDPPKSEDAAGEDQPADDDKAAVADAADDDTAASDAAPADDKPTTTTVNINGRHVEFTDEQLKQYAVNQLTRQPAAARQPAPAPDPANRPAPPAPAEERTTTPAPAADAAPAKLSDEELTELVDQIQVGTPQQVQEALRKLTQQPAAPAADAAPAPAGDAAGGGAEALTPEHAVARHDAMLREREMWGAVQEFDGAINDREWLGRAAHVGHEMRGEDLKAIGYDANVVDTYVVEAKAGNQEAINVLGLHHRQYCDLPNKGRTLAQIARAALQQTRPDAQDGATDPAAGKTERDDQATNRRIERKRQAGSQPTTASRRTDAARQAPAPSRQQQVAQNNASYVRMRQQAKGGRVSAH